MKILASYGPVSIKNGSLSHWQNSLDLSDVGDVIAVKAECGAILGHLGLELGRFSLEHKELLRQRKACVVYEWTEEAESYQPVINQIENFCTIESIDLDLFWYLTGNYSSTCQKINVRHVPLYLAVASWAIPIFEDHEHRKTHVFLCLMRNPHTHRWITLVELSNNNLLDKGLVSFSGTKEDYAIYHGPRLNPLLLDRLPLIVDIPTKVYDPRVNWNSGFGPELYQRTHFSLVVESHSDRVFFTEKICKPLAYGHPFIVIGGQHYLQTLRSLGFQTFSQWWDESYDTVVSDQERIQAGVNLMQKVCEWSEVEWHDFHAASNSVTNHNRELVRSEKFMSKVLEILGEIKVQSSES
jgi:hypothetical protein